MLATTTKAQDFWNVSMWITLDPVDKAGWPPCLSQGWDSRDRDDVSKDGRTWNYIFSRDDLPTFCKFIVTRGWDGPMFDLRDTIIYIDINPAIITYIHGDVWEALRQLREAGGFAPLTEEEKSMREAWQKKRTNMCIHRNVLGRM